jgi:hypothetical protein
MSVRSGVQVTKGEAAASMGASKAGTGYSQTAASPAAGAEAARNAMAAAGAERCSLALVFANSRHDPAAVRDGVRKVIGPDARLVGGASVGVITNDFVGFEGPYVGVAVVESDTLKVDVFRALGLNEGERPVGEALARQIREGSFDGDPNLLVLYDIVKEQVPEGVSLNLATPLLAGMDQELGGKWPSTAGGGLLGDMHWNPTFQFVDDEILHQAALGIVLHGGVRMDTMILRGCKPSSGYHTITKSDGHVVLELDGKPMADVVSELMGHGSDEALWADYPIFITLGVNHGDKFGEYREEDYAVRLCMDVDRERRGLAFFGDDLVAGTEVQLMRRSLDFDYVRGGVEELLDRTEGRRPLLALYIDCAGRAQSLSGMESDEAEELQRALGDRVPLLGWYVGGEIARAGDDMESHNWTGILCLLSE